MSTLTQLVNGRARKHTHAANSTAPQCMLRPLLPATQTLSRGPPGLASHSLREHWVPPSLCAWAYQRRGDSAPRSNSGHPEPSPCGACQYSLRVWGSALTSFTSGSLSGRCTSTMTKCWFVPVCSGWPEGEGSGRQPPTSVASVGGLFRCGGDWTRGKGPMRCWVTRARWASSGLLEPGFAGETEA